MAYDLSRFVVAHRRDFPTALKEVRNGRKLTHWMWYVFPQIKGLGHSHASEFYGIRDLGEAVAFLADPYLGDNLRTISQALLDLEGNNPLAIFGNIDYLKLKSCMTLFACAAPEESVFRAVLQRYYDGSVDQRTLIRLGRSSI